MDYVITTHDAPGLSIVSIRGRCDTGGVPGFVGGAFRELFGRLRLLGVAPAGHPFVIYHEFGPDGVDAEACVPVAGPVSASGTVKARTLPARTVARTVHVGPYENLGAAYAALTHWIRSKGFESAGPICERYLDGPADQVSPAEYRTEIETPIVASLVAVPV
jgi:effector-binding domain-containing protein